MWVSLVMMSPMLPVLLLLLLLLLVLQTIDYDCWLRRVGWLMLNVVGCQWQTLVVIGGYRVLSVDDCSRWLVLALVNRNGSSFVWLALTDVSRNGSPFVSYVEDVAGDDVGCW